MSIKRANTDQEKDEKAQDVANYLLGNKDLGIEPLTIAEITRIMGFKKEDSTRAYKNRAIEKGFIELDDQGKPKIPEKTPAKAWKLFSENHSILNDPYMAEWWDAQLSKKGSKGIVIAKPMLQVLEQFFNTMRITPEMLILKGKKNRKEVEILRNQYMKKYKAGESWFKVKNKKLGSPDTKQLRLNYALVSLVSLFGITWERNSSAMSRKIVRHAQYSGIRLTTEEFKKADEWIIENHGKDSNLYRWFWVGVEACPRFGALYAMKLDYQIIKSKDKSNFSNDPNKIYPERETFVFEVYEAKTKEINGGIWRKFIKRKGTQESLAILKKRGGTRIYETEKNADRFTKEILKQLRELFLALGKAPDSFFIQKPSHALRHIGAHWLLSKGNYTNHVLVARVGGWHTIDELIKSYGQLPAEKINEELDKYDYET